MWQKKKLFSKSHVDRKDSWRKFVKLTYFKPIWKNFVKKRREIVFLWQKQFFVKIMSTEKIPKENEGLLGSTQNSNNIHIIKSSTTKDSEGKTDVFLRSWISNEPGDHSHLSLVFPFIKCWGLCFYTIYLFSPRKKYNFLLWFDKALSSST